MDGVESASRAHKSLQGKVLINMAIRINFAKDRPPPGGSKTTGNKSADLDPSKNYIFGYHPHGVISVGALLTFASEATGFANAFPGIDVRLLTLSVNFFFPFTREVLMALGINSVTRSSVEKNLLRVKSSAAKKPRGNAVVIVVGGANKWTYDSFVNWDTFPAGWIDQPQGPILIYFKETQTPSDQWNVGPGESANSPEAIAKGAVPGQVHFFPAICNAKQITAEFAKRGCKKL